MDGLVDDLLQELECLVCFEYMLPPITLCTNGHSTCHFCKSTLEHCPTCRGNLLDTRSRPMENLSNRITHPCKFRKSGCTAQCLVDFKEQHQKECLFSPHKCPFFITDNCVWVDSLLHLKEHVEDTKGHYIYPIDEQNLISSKPSLKDGAFTRGFIFTLDEIFFAHSKQMNNFLHVVVMFVGTKEQAKNYKYKIRIKTADKQSMSACFTCRSYLEFLERPLTFSDARSAVFPTTFWENDTTLASREKFLPFTLVVVRSTLLDKED